MCENLASAEVVTACGDAVRASEDENADLFWGIRGGGGNFGIVTEFEFRLHPLGPVLSVEIRFGAVEVGQNQDVKSSARAAFGIASRLRL